MPWKLVALDLDGTLLRSDNTLAPRTVTAVQRIRNAGIHVVIATGRMFVSAANVASTFGDPMPIVAYNGAFAKLPGKEPPLVYLPLDCLLARDVLHFFRDQGWYIQSYTDDILQVETLNEKARAYGKLAGTTPHSMGELLYTPSKGPLKLLSVADSPEEAHGMRQSVVKRFGNAVSAVLSTARFLDIGHADVSKGYALKRVAAFLGISSSEILAMGDSENDRDLFAAAGYRVAMGNADPSLKALADTVSETNDNDGVAIFLEQFF